MNRPDRHVLLIALLSSMLVAGVAAAGPVGGPNILLIMADDVVYTDLG